MPSENLEVDMPQTLHPNVAKAEAKAQKNQPCRFWVRNVEKGRPFSAPLVLCLIDGWHALKGRGWAAHHALSGRATHQSTTDGALGAQDGDYRLSADRRKRLGQGKDHSTIFTKRRVLDNFDLT
jgi:hypothetical protein